MLSRVRVDPHCAQGILLLITDAHRYPWRYGALSGVELLSFVPMWYYSAAMTGQTGDAMSLRSTRRSRTVDRRKPLVELITTLNSADIPPGIATLGGGSAVFNFDTDLIECLCSSVVEMSKSSVRSVTSFISADLPHGVANGCRKGQRNSTVLPMSPTVCVAALSNSANLWSNM